jgi:hypothetical protein
MLKQPKAPEADRIFNVALQDCIQIIPHSEKEDLQPITLELRLSQSHLLFQYLPGSI